MRKLFFLLPLLFLNCESDDGRNQNPFLVDIAFQMQLNTNLPQYSALNFPNNSVIVQNAGLRGVLVFRTGNDQYLAFELSDPNHSPNDCSRMSLENSTILSCPCTDDSNRYDINFGLPIEGDGLYGLKQYRVNRSGDVVTISN